MKEPQLRQRARRKLSVAPALLLFLSLVMVPAGAQQAQEDDDVVRVNTDLVVLNVTVLDANGKYVHGLRRADFKVVEDGREQAITDFSDEETPFAAAVLLDTSGSMDQRVSFARSAAIRFLDGLRADDVAAVFRFDTNIEQVQEFSPSHDLAPTAFAMQAKGQTALNDAVLRAAKELNARTEKRRAIIVLSDGGDNHSSASFEKALASAIAANATVYTINMASMEGGANLAAQSATGLLKGYAGKSGGRYISTPGGQALRDAFGQIVEELGNQYTITYRPSNRAHDGRFRSIEVKLPQSSLSIRTRKGYHAPKQ